MNRPNRAVSWLRRARVVVRHPVTLNAMALYAAQLARYLIPLALLPFLARVLRPEAFGRLAIAQSYASLLAVVVEFGFMYSATREIARQQACAAIHGRIAASVLGAKGLLAVGAVALTAAVLAAVPGFRGLGGFFWGACFLAIAQGASPSWFFQGIEHMGRQTGIDVLGMATGAGLVFGLVRGPRQAPWELFLMGTGVLGATVVNHVRMYRQIGIEAPGLGSSLQMLRHSLGLFFLRASIVLYAGANAFLLGLLVPAAAVADFAGAEKIARASTGLFGAATQALFPRFSRLMVHNQARGLRMARLFLAGFAVLSVLGSGALAWAAPWAVHICLGAGYESAVPLLRWLALLLPLISVNFVLAFQFMIPLGMDKETNRVIGSAAVVNIALMLLLVPRAGTLGMVWSILASESIVAAGMGLCLIRRRATRHNPGAARAAGA